HEFWQHGTGSIAVPGEEDGRFEQWLETGDGRYVIQLAPDDTRAEVTNISLSLRSGLLQRLTLGFQRGGQGIKPDMIERRFPGCRGVLDALVARYGQPQAFVSEMEDNLEHRVRSWRGPEGTLHLDCGRFTGRTAIFAMDIEIEAPGTPSAWPEPAPKPARKKR
ncbi:MAG: hypothetical protein KIT73_08560, partial [Burkholderiales bacterium]|nr:hypothetical protein [Burkholderiales bacterium]